MLHCWTLVPFCVFVGISLRLWYGSASGTMYCFAL
jgi:hypothetical protein